MSWPLVTERLALRRATADDVEATWRYRQLPEVAQWVEAAPQSLDEYRHWYTDHHAHDVIVECDHVVIGTISIKLVDPWGQRENRELTRGTQAELGWTFDPAYGGKGYATEAVRAVIAQCFNTLGLRRVVAECFAANEPSWRLMERVGMRREGYYRKDSLHRSGQWLDGMSYALLAEEWS